MPPFSNTYNEHVGFFKSSKLNHQTDMIGPSLKYNIRSVLKFSIRSENKLRFLTASHVYVVCELKLF